MKDGDNLATYLSAEPTSEESTVASAVVSGVVSEHEGNDSQPQPPESEDEPCVVSVNDSHPPAQPLQRSKPDWWPPA
jgi:hypothetical protein